MRVALGPRRLREAHADASVPGMFKTMRPPQVESLDEQVVRAYKTYQHKGDDLGRHIYLRA
jgi:hypothetical protein